MLKRSPLRRNSPIKRAKSKKTNARRSKIDKSKLAFGEPERIRDEKHRRFISSLFCCVCGSQQEIQCCHLRTGGTGGTALKPSDNLCIPGCATCHAKSHATSEMAVWGDPKKAERLAMDLFALTGDKEKAVFRVFQFMRER